MHSASAYFQQAASCFNELAGSTSEIEQAAAVITEALRAGGKVMFCGNGGSAADSQHLAAELLGRYQLNRAPLPAIALTVDTSAMTAIANDFGFEDVFARQLRGLGRKGDVLVALSTSGGSANVLAAVAAAREMGVKTIGLAGRSGGRLKAACDIAICAPGDETCHIQELHIAIGHYLCGVVEAALA